jgi:hypothetical protein
VGDTDGLIGSQNFVRTYQTEKKEKAESEASSWYVRTRSNDPMKIFLAYQNLIKKQIDWLISNLGFPVHLKEVVRDIWTVWISTQKIHKGRPDFKTIGPQYTLIFCHIGAKLLGLNLQLIDIQRQVRFNG